MRRRRSFKGLAAMLSLFLLSLLLVPAALAADVETSKELGKPKNVYTLSAYAVPTAAGSDSVTANVYLSVSSEAAGVSAPVKLEKVDLDVYDAKGNLRRATKLLDVASPGGIAQLEVPNSPLGTRLSVQIHVKTPQSHGTEVLQAEMPVADFSVDTSKITVSSFQGYGAQFNMHLYTALNDPARGFIGNEPPKELDNVESKVIAMKPGLSRIFLAPVNFDPGNENRMASFIKTIELAQAAGTTMNVTWWSIERAPGDDPVKQDELMHENMRQFADTLVDLIVNRGLTAVKQITIQNEVNTTWIKPELYEQYYRLLDQYLKEAGIRDRIQFVGGDLVFNNQLVWFTHMADHMGDVLDGWSVHIYWNTWDTAYMQTRFSDIKSIYNNIAPEKRKPLSVTEYGVRGYKVYDNDPKKPIMDVNPYRVGAQTATLAGKADDLVTGVNETNLAAFEQAWFNMQAVNLGFTGLSKWDAYRAQYDFTYQDYSLIGYNFNPAAGEDRWPLRPAYYMQWLMGNTTGKTWQVLGYNGASGSKLITPFRGPSGEWTVFAISTDRSAATFNVGQLPADTDFQVLLWNADGKGKVTNGVTVNSGKAGYVSVNAPADSFVVLTTVKTGELPK